MTKEEMNKLDRGDIISHESGSHILLVTGNYGSFVIATEVWHVTNPPEWKLISKASYKQASPVKEPN